MLSGTPEKFQAARYRRIGSPTRCYNARFRRRYMSACNSERRIEISCDETCRYQVERTRRPWRGHCRAYGPRTKAARPASLKSLCRYDDSDWPGVRGRAR